MVVLMQVFAQCVLYLNLFIFFLNEEFLPSFQNRKSLRKKI